MKRIDIKERKEKKAISRAHLAKTTTTTPEDCKLCVGTYTYTYQICDI